MIGFMDFAHIDSRWPCVFLTMFTIAEIKEAVKTSTAPNPPASASSQSCIDLEKGNRLLLSFVESK
jgi:hypothetical protein